MSSVNRIFSLISLTVVLVGWFTQSATAQSTVWTRYHYWSPATCVRVSPDEHSLAVGMNDTTLLIYSLDNTQLLHSMSLGQYGIPTSLDFLSDGRILAGTSLGQVILCNPFNDSIEWIAAINGLVCSIDARSNLIAAASSQGDIILVNTDHKVVMNDFVTATPDNHVALRTDGQQLAYSNGIKFNLFNVPTFKTEQHGFVTTMDEDTVTPILDLAYSPDGTKLYFSEQDSGLFEYRFSQDNSSFDSIRKVYTFPLDNSFSTFSSLGNRFSFRTSKGISIYDFDSEAVIQTVSLPGHLSAWTLDPSGNSIAIASFDGLEYNSIEKGPQQSLWGHNYPISAITATADGTRITTVDGESGIAKCWDAHTGLRLWSLYDPLLMPWVTAESAVGDSTVIIARRNDQVGLYRLSNGTLITVLGDRNFNRNVCSLAMAGDSLFVFHTDSTFSIWSIGTRVKLSDHSLPLYAHVSAVSGSGRYVAASNEVYLSIYDLATETSLQNYVPQPRYVHTLQFTRDEHSLLAGTDGFSTIYSIGDLSQRNFGANGFSSFAFDESEIVSASADSTIQTTNLSSQLTGGRKLLVCSASCFTFIPKLNSIAIGTAAGDVQLIAISGSSSVARNPLVSSTIQIRMVEANNLSSAYIMISGLSGTSGLDDGSSTPGAVSLRVIDLTGRTEFSNVYRNSRNALIVPVSEFGNLAEGVYLIAVECDGQQGSGKVIMGE